MLGSANSLACANIMLNASVAEELRQFADILEKSEDFEGDLHKLIQKTIKEHKHIIFNGNGYDDSWIKVATEERGLMNLRTTPDAIPHLLDKKNVDMLTSLEVFTEDELKSRYEITLENYCKTVIIEANTMVDMARMQIAPAVEKYAASVAKSAAAKKALDAELACSYETTLVRKLSALTDRIAVQTDLLEAAIMDVAKAGDVGTESAMIRDTLLAKMGELRVACDEAETLTAKSYWPFPTYADILFSVR